MRQSAMLLISCFFASAAVAQVAPTPPTATPGRPGAAAAPAPATSGRPMVKEIGYGGRNFKDTKGGVAKMVPLPANFGWPPPSSSKTVAAESLTAPVTPNTAQGEKPSTQAGNGAGVTSQGQGAGGMPPIMNAAGGPQAAMPPLPPIAPMAQDSSAPKELRSDKKLTSDASKIRDRQEAEAKKRAATEAANKAKEAINNAVSAAPLPNALPVMPKY